MDCHSLCIIFFIYTSSSILCWMLRFGTLELWVFLAIQYEFVCEHTRWFCGLQTFPFDTLHLGQSLINFCLVVLNYSFRKNDFVCFDVIATDSIKTICKIQSLNFISYLYHELWLSIEWVLMRCSFIFLD